VGKRLTGFLSWHLKRRKIHDPRILEIVVRDIKASAPDHVAVTGDLINISLAAEYRNAQRWLGEFGGPDWISVVPGNHDAYMPMDWEEAFGLWADYFAGEVRLPADRGACLASRFPYLRFRRNIAIIGASTAVPTSPGMATGLLGEPQIARLNAALRQTRERGFYRVLLLHHPPLEGLAPRRKSLLDGAGLLSVLEGEGAELVLYGHNHRHQQSCIDGLHGKVHIIGVPSASQGLHNGATAAWNLFAIRREEKTWFAEMTTRCFDPVANSMATGSTQTLTYN
jgi:3',5'-cyclic AMP phosphodiesterase CpdA